VDAILLTVAYDGTDFAGWARQPGKRTVQGTLEDAVATMNGAFAVVRSASRTDAGVHALGQVAAFDPVREIPLDGWILGLNAALSLANAEDLVVRDAKAVAPEYTPRFDSVNKLYRYLLCVDAIRDPLTRHRAWQLGKKVRGKDLRPVSVEAMREGASHLMGTHDFRAFRSADDKRDNATRTITRFDIIEGYGGDPRIIALEVVGNAFMKNMVRILTGTLVEVGTGVRDPASLPALLGPTVERGAAGVTAPSHGLTLVWVGLGRSQLTG